ncbi:MAG: hypothetical protein JWP35_406 [Caulobacter sp.]|nr:hypothetical protein [Caulobacter sp.]
MSTAFPEKLRLVLKLLSVSNTRLAAELGIDKSVVSRWLSGAVKPSEFNRSRLTALVASHVPGFRLIDWDRDPAALADIFRPGGGEEHTPAHPAPNAGRAAAGLTLPILDQAVLATALRGRAYEGFFRTMRLADGPAGGFANDYSYVRMGDNGLLRTSMSSLGSVAEGWLLPLHNQVYLLVSDATSGGMTYSIMNGLASTKVETMDGVGIGAGHDPGRTPTALNFLVDRIGDLSGDPNADAAHFADLCRINALPTEADLTPELLAHILPDFGPAAAQAGGAWVLQIKRGRSISRSAPPDEQIAAGPATPSASARPADKSHAAFAEKFGLVLKLLSLSSAQMAAALEVDKSVISRWLSGGVEPSSHNLARLTGLIATRRPGFSTLDWERSPEGLLQLFGADPALIPGHRSQGGPVLTLSIWEQIIASAALRGTAYEGFFRLTRPSTQDSGAFVEEYGLIQPDPCGLPRFRLAAAGAMFDGWLLSVHDQVHVVACDPVGGVMINAILNGIGAARVAALDGLILSPTLDVERAPSAMPVLLEYVAGLTGEPEADERRFEDLAGRQRTLSPDDLEPRTRARLMRDCGPTAYAGGGAMLLQMPLEGSLTRAGALPRA